MIRKEYSYEKIISGLLAIALILGIYPVTVRAVNSQDNAATFELAENKNDGGQTDAKIHFYIDDNEKYYNIYDDEICMEAFAYMKELHSRIILENDLIQITIRFDNDFTR